MKIQSLLSAACVLLTAVPSALAEVSFIRIAMYIPSDMFHMMPHIIYETYHVSFFLYCSSINTTSHNIYHHLYLSIHIIQEQSHAVAKPIDAFEDVLASAGLYDPEDEDSYDMEDVAKKDGKKVRRSLVLFYVSCLCCVCDLSSIYP